MGVLGLDVRLVSAAGEPGPLLDHLGSTLVAGVKISTARGLGDADGDVIWVGSPAATDEVFEAARRGALVVVTDASLLRERMRRVAWTTARFPDVAPDLKALAALLERLLGAVDEPHLPMLFGRPAAAAVDLRHAEPLVESDDGAWCARVRVGRGEILWLGLFPELDGAGFRPESHVPLRAAACQLMVDETLAYAFRRKHAVSVRKLFGPYGAPMMAWQAHVEEIGGLSNRSMERLVGRLANSRQVPTFSLIRRSFRWGHRAPGLVYLPWATDPRGGVRGQPGGTSVFPGQWITLDDGSELGFPGDDRYVEYHVRIPEQPRIYPAPCGDGALALGTPDGRIELFSVTWRDGRVSLTRRGPLRLADGTVLETPGASPTFGATADGRLLVVGDDAGTLRVYVEDERGWSEAKRFELGAPVAPRLVDWTGSGTLDLMVGTEDGAVDLFEDFERVGTAGRRRLFRTYGTWVTPWPVVSACERRVVFGEYRGRLWVWQDGRTTPIESRDSTMTGPTEIFLQQHSVPVVVDADGRELLIVGASVVGRPHDLGDTAEPATTAVRDTVERLAKSGTPCNPHLFLFRDASAPEVSAELSRHRESFAALGLPWDGQGANQHGWWIPREQAALALLLERTSGLCFNFGWQSPGTRGAPDSDPGYALSFPHLLRYQGARVDFVLHAPALPCRYPRALETMAAAGLPLTFFVHPEYRAEGPAAAELDRWVGSVDELKRRHGYVSLTENQMAKAIAVTLTSEVRVVCEGGRLRVEADRSAVPSWAREFGRTLAVAVDWTGPPPALATDGLGCVRGPRVIASVEERTMRPSGESAPRWRVTAANGPIEVGPGGVEVLAPGFQELHVAGAGVTVDWPGAHVRQTEDGLVLTRFGEPGPARLHLGPVAPPGVPWSSHPSKQDRWVIENVFRGRTSPGYFVETGAADGVSASATLALERGFGWTGIVVEPNFLFFQQLKKNRRCRVANVCVAEQSGPTEFIQASWFGRIHEHFQDGVAERDHLQDPFLEEDFDGAPAKVVRMTALSLEDVLVHYGAPRRIDFMSIDAEFSEWFILRAFPFQRWEVLSLCVHSKFTHAGRLFEGKHTEDIRRLLGDLGYFYDREYSRRLEHDFFVHPSVIEHPLPDPPVSRRA